MDRLRRVTFSTADGSPIQIEGLLHTVERQGLGPAAVVCHPHPLGGGTMHNGIVSAIARSLASQGIMALRFNFRGVGHSGGEHTYGQGEQADVAAALNWILGQPHVDPSRLWVAGYSFGAWVGLSQAQADPRVTAVAAVGLGAWHYDAQFARTHPLPELGSHRWVMEEGFLRAFSGPKLFVVGDRDPFSPAVLLREWVEQLPPPKTLRVVPGSDHFMQGHEQEVGDLVASYLAGL